MKATVEMICGRYSVVGLEKPSFKLSNSVNTEDKPVYELTYLYGLGSRTYKTLANAIRAIEKHGLEYIPLDSILTVCGYN
ncbi:MAG: hypothetical protein IJF32_04010 [Oscillospiraceae bacterium]|nr:hypothetical protein [Oscillospiraceae bacterium]